MRLFDTEILTNTLWKKTLKDHKDIYGNYAITGFMGSGKTYFAVLSAFQYFKNLPIKTNIKSLYIKGRNIETFVRLEDIYQDNQEKILYIIDELDTLITKDTKPMRLFVNFLQHSRKLKRVVLFIYHDYSEMPSWLRKPLKYLVVTTKVRFLPLFKTYICNARQPFLNENKEWEAPKIYKIVYKRTKEICNMYNTYEQIIDL